MPVKLFLFSVNIILLEFPKIYLCSVLYFITKKQILNDKFKKTYFSLSVLTGSHNLLLKKIKDDLNGQ